MYEPIIEIDVSKLENLQVVVLFVNDCEDD